MSNHYHRSEPIFPYRFGQETYTINNRHLAETLNQTAPDSNNKTPWNKGMNEDTYNMDGLGRGQSQIYTYKTNQDAEVSSRRMRNHARERGCNVTKSGRRVEVWRAK